MSWERAYALLDRHKSSQMLLAPLFADYICRNGLDPVDNGNTEYNVRLGIEKGTLATKVLGLLLPETNNLSGRYAEWRTMLSENVREHKYSIIAVLPHYHPLVYQDDLEKYYHRIDEANLQLAGEENWLVGFWVPNPER